MKRAFAEIPEGQVFYRTDGSGEPVLLLHQSPSSSEEYLEVIPYLASNFRAIAMDTPGYGLSDDPPHDYEITDYARSVISFLDALGLAKINIVGHHTGGTIAVEIGAAYPERVDKLILSGCPTMNKDEWQAFLKQINAPAGFTSHLEIPDDDGTFLQEYWQRTKSGNPQMSPREWVQSIFNRIMTYTRPHNAIIAVMNYDVLARMPLIKSPTLVTAGSRDPVSAQLESTQKLISRSRIVVTPDASAAIAREKPREFADTITNFITNPGV